MKGKLGNFVLRQVNGKTVMCSLPAKSSKPKSKDQEIQHERFKAAVAYAKDINSNPEKKKLYSGKLKKGQTVFQFAIKEFFNNK